MDTRETELLVIGSGFGAAAPALRMAKAGFRVLMVEKGRRVVPEKDFRQTSDPKYLLEYLKSASGDSVSFTFAEALGGGSGFYEMVSLRAPTGAFEQRDEHGVRLWPGGLDRTAMDPYYDRAEEMLGVEQIPVEEIPRSGIVFSRMMKNMGYSCDRARYAVRGCVGSGFCVTGCVYGAKQSLHVNYLPQAEAAGAEVMTDCEAVSIRPLSPLEEDRTSGSLRALPHRYEVVFIDRKTGKSFAVHAKLLILAGGTVGSAALLLRSAEQLPRLGSHVGQHIAFNGSVKAAGILPEGFIEGDMFAGRSHPGMISYHFLESLGVTISSAKPLPILAIHGMRLVAEGETRRPSYWGQAHVDLMKLYRKRMIVLYALGLTPPTASLSLSGSDLRASLDVSGELRGYHDRTQELLHGILRGNGCRVIETTSIDHDGTPVPGTRFETSHMVGSCRMADSRDRGVVDAFGEAFAYPGLYVTDGAAVPSSLAVNSSLTILANAERIAAHLVKRYRR